MRLIAVGLMRSTAAGLMRLTMADLGLLERQLQIWAATGSGWQRQIWAVAGQMARAEVQQRSAVACERRSSGGDSSSDNGASSGNGVHTSYYMKGKWVSAELLVKSSDTILRTDKWNIKNREVNTIKYLWKRFLCCYCQVHIDDLYNNTIKH